MRESWVRTIGRVGFLSSLSLLLVGCQAASNTARSKAGASPREVTPPALLTSELCREGLPETGNWKSDPVFADVNGDGSLDLAAHVRLAHGPAVWLGAGQGGWRDSSEGLSFGTMNSCGGGLAFGDVNGDGHLDLVVADHCQGLFVYLGDGAGHWEMTTRALYPREVVSEQGPVEQYTGAEDVAVGDLNGDGFVDLVAGASDNGGGISVYLGDGTGRNWKLHPCGLPNWGWATRVLLADMNGDGKLDVVASQNEGPRVWMGDGQGGLRPASEGFPTPSIKGIYNGLAVGDVNGDGRPDLAVANWVDGPEVYLQQADGSWRKTPDVFPQMLGGAYGLALGDLDQDGHLDVVVSGRLTQEVGYVYGVHVLRGDGAGGFRWLAGGGLPKEGLAFTWGVALGDVNGDGVLDVAAGSGGTVATNPERMEPTLSAGMLVWCTRLPGR